MELDDLSKRLARCWDSLGRKLDVDENQIENIAESNHLTTPSKKAFEILKSWKNSGESVTYGKLAAALREEGMGRLAKEFE